MILSSRALIIKFVIPNRAEGPVRNLLFVCSGKEVALVTNR
jgi:hypothetical protein